MASETDWRKLRPLEQLLIDNQNGNNAAIITAIFNIEGKVSADWTTEYIAKRLLVHPRFSSVLSHHRGRARFVPVAAFAEDPVQLARHVIAHEASIAPPSSAALGEIVSAQLPFDRPLWSLHVFPGKEGSASAIVFRVHHCIGDGIGLLRFFLTVVADGPPAPPSKSPSPLPARRPLHHRLVPRHQLPIPRLLCAVIRPLRDAISVFIKPLIPDPPTVFTRAATGASKRAVFARAVPLPVLTSAARMVGVSINDLVLASVAGALREYALRHGDKPRDLRRFHVGIPFNRHPVTDGVDTVVNAVMVLPMRAPLLLTDRVGRLAVCSERMRFMKGGLQPVFADVAFRIVRALPRIARIPVWRRLTRIASALLTNMAGPPGKLRTGGREVTNVRVFAPSQGYAGMTISAISYAGMFNVGLLCDERQVSEPELFVRLFNQELDALVAWTKEIEVSYAFAQ